MHIYNQPLVHLIMSVIQRIREKGAWIIFAIIAIALIAFIMQDASFRHGGGIFSNSNNIGKVNGTAITKEEFDNEVSIFEQRYGKQMPTNQLMPAVWNELVQQVILQARYNSLGLNITPEELSGILFGNTPPQWLTQAFTDPNTGIFDINKAKQFFASIKRSRDNTQVSTIYNVYIEPEIEQRLFQKYQQLLSHAAYIPSWLVDKTNADNNIRANLSFVSIPYTAVSDSLIQVSDADVSGYEKSHSSEFQQLENSRSITYVSFNDSPTATDSVTLKSDFLDLLPGFTLTNSNTVAAFLNRVGTETPYTGLYQFKPNMSYPHIDSIVNLSMDKVYGPFVFNNNYNLIKMLDKKMIPDSVRCRHILIKTVDNGQVVLPDSIAKKRIDSIALAISKGANFDSLALKYSDDIGSKNKGGVYTFAYEQFSTISKEFASTIFYNPVRTKKVVSVENQAYSGYHYIEVLNQSSWKQGYQTALLSKAIVVSQTTDDSVSAVATNFASAITSPNQFYIEANQLHLFPLTTPDIHESDYSINGIGDNRDFVRWVYKNPIGTISDPTLINNQYIVAMIVSIDNKGLYSVAKARPLCEAIIKNNKKATIIISTKIKGDNLSSIAQANGMNVQKADSVSFINPFVPNVGNEPKLVGAGFCKLLVGNNTISKPIIGTAGVFVIQNPINFAVSSTTALDMIRQYLLQQQTANIAKSIDVLRKVANIQDNRFNY